MCPFIKPCITINILKRKQLPIHHNEIIIIIKNLTEKKSNSRRRQYKIEFFVYLCVYNINKHT